MKFALLPGKSIATFAPNFSQLGFSFVVLTNSVIKSYEDHQPYQRDTDLAYPE